MTKMCAKKMVAKIREWARESTPRWVAIALCAWMGAVSALYGTAVMERQDLIEANQDRARSLAFCEVYRQFTKLYDVADPERENEQANLLRAELDARFKELNRVDAIDLEVC